MNEPQHIARSALTGALPIITGYLPIALAFGMAGVVHGVPSPVLVAMSAIIFAGGSQFVLLAAMHMGTPWYLVVGLCALMDARHVLYGTVLVRWLPSKLGRQLLAASTLTDEVFATALVKIPGIDRDQRLDWLIGLGLFSYLSWLTGTVLGVTVGARLSHVVPLLARAMPFALPSLFVVLTYESVTPKMRLPVTISVMVAGLLYLQGWTGLALLGGSLCGCGSVFLREIWR